MADTYSHKAMQRPLAADIAIGAAAGLIGGLAFGVLMAMMAMLPMIGMLVGAESAFVGFLVHMVISAVIGAIYGAVVNVLHVEAAFATWTGLGIGLVYGFVWWILGPLVIMPTMMGMGPQFAAALNQMNLMSLMGHLIYGALTGIAFALIASRR